MSITQFIVFVLGVRRLEALRTSVCLCVEEFLCDRKIAANMACSVRGVSCHVLNISAHFTEGCNKRKLNDRRGEFQLPEREKANNITRPGSSLHKHIFTFRMKLGPKML